MNPLAPEFIPRSKRNSETFLRIFNDTMKQFLTAAAASSSIPTASTQFPNVMGGTGLVPPPPMPPFAYQVNPQAFFPPVAGCIPPPPRHPPPPPLHPHAVSARRFPASPIQGSFDPYMTVPPLPPIPPPWACKWSKVLSAEKYRDAGFCIYNSHVKFASWPQVHVACNILDHNSVSQ